MRLDRALARFSLGSRKEVKQIIKHGRVEVNAKVIYDENMKLQWGDAIQVDNHVYILKEFEYYLLNKPAGYVTSKEAGHYPSVYELFDPPLYPDSHPFGRLDADTEGLLIFSNDGQLNHQLMSPKKHIEKTYAVYLKEPFDELYIHEIEKGMILGEEQLKPASVEVMDKCLIYLTLTEGKYHQVKRMMHACQNEVVRLVRIRLADLELDNLEPGEYRELTDSEIMQLKI